MSLRINASICIVFIISISSAQDFSEVLPSRTVFARGQNAMSMLTSCNFATAPEDTASLFFVRHKGVHNIYNPKSQMFNHLVDSDALTNKGSFARHMQFYNSSRSGVVIPTTYLLTTTEEKQQFKRTVAKDLTGVWILKRVDLSQGFGITILPNVQRWVAGGGLQRVEDTHHGYVLQKYLLNPLLLDGKKSEIRMYWMIVALKPLVAVLFREGTVRLNSRKYDLQDFSNPLVHITNDRQQRIHNPSGYSALKSQGQLKWTFSHLQEYLTQNKGVDERWMEDVLVEKVRKALYDVLEITRETLLVAGNPAHRYELFGVDIILDDHLTPHLTEVQLGPGLSYDDMVKSSVLPVVVCEVAEIALEWLTCERKVRNGDSSSSCASLQAMKHSVYIVNEA